MVRDVEGMCPPGPSPSADRAAELFRLLHPLGGAAEGNCLAGVLRAGRPQPISVLARWIVDRRVVHFARHSSMFLPWFQFRRAPDAAIEPWPGIRDVLVELDPLFDGCEIATWFATPSPWLQGRPPATCVASDPREVARAARVERYVAKGD